jgi:hypothetical protein
LLFVYDNPSLVRIDTLSNLTTAVSVGIGANAVLSSVSFPALVQAHELQLFANSALETVDGFPSLRAANYLKINRNSALTRIQGLPSLASLLQFEIGDNPELRSIGGAPALEIVTYLDILRNAKLPTCEAQRFANEIEFVDTLNISGNDDAGMCGP